VTDLVFLTHAPSRPKWTCMTDGEDWPCDGAKRELRRTFAGRGIALGAYLSDRVQEAAGELEGMEEDDLLRRFVLWPTRDDPR
jgi:hypothetical protein